MNETEQRSPAMLAVSNAMVRLHKQQFGRGLTKARSYYAGPDTLLSIPDHAAEGGRGASKCRGDCAKSRRDFWLNTIVIREPASSAIAIMLGDIEVAALPRGPRSCGPSGQVYESPNRARSSGRTEPFAVYEEPARG